MLPLITGETSEVLLKKTKLVSNPLAEDIQKLLPKMVATMHKENGVGLAAPQIGISLRLAVAEVRKRLYYLINPEITSYSQEKIVSEEGCLSIPGEFFPIFRSETVTVKYINEKGLPKKMRASGFLATVIQHEVDHLDGILIVNRFDKQKNKPDCSMNPRPHTSKVQAQKSVTPKVRVVFFGTPHIAATVLGALLENSYNVVGVVTKKDAPVGRKRTIVASPVKTRALAQQIPTLEPEKLDRATLEQIKAWKPDLFVVFAYGKILPQALLTLPGFGCVNFHPSLLPCYRGASPIQNALLNGETETGVTLILMDQGMDTGDVLAQIKMAIALDDTTETLSRKLLEVGIPLLLDTLPALVLRTLEPKKQDGSLATSCQMIERADGHIIWNDEAVNIWNRYRAFAPWPGIFTYYKKNDELFRLKLQTISYQKEDTDEKRPIGQVFLHDDRLGVQTARGIVFLDTVQLEGKIALPGKVFAQGDPLFIESFLE